jgi:hypothetical protein
MTVGALPTGKGLFDITDRQVGDLSITENDVAMEIVSAAAAYSDCVAGLGVSAIS